MKKIAWITDSTCSLDPNFAKQHDIHIVPMGITFDQETYKDGVDITEEMFYEKLASSPSLPTSSQPSIGEMVELYESLKEHYDLGIAVHISSDLSGTANASKQAAEMAEFPLELVDSRLLSLPMSEMILKGQALISEGVSPEETAERLRNLHKKNELYVMIGSLDQLHKGGRVNTLQLMIGSLLKVKPILIFEDGKLVPHEKVRSQKKALSYMVSRLKEDLENGETIKKVFILQAGAKDELQFLIEEIKNISDEIEIAIGPLGAAVGVHAGSGTIALSWYKN